MSQAHMPINRDSSGVGSWELPGCAALTPSSSPAWEEMLSCLDKPVQDPFTVEEK